MRFSTRWPGPTAVLLGAVVGVWAACDIALSEPEPGKPVAGKRPYNVLFVICDQEAYRLFARGDFPLPARDALKRRGVTFRNHYIGSAVCTPSRALFITGTPPPKEWGVRSDVVRDSAQSKTRAAEHGLGPQIVGLPDGLLRQI
jgi:hypothetical protein